MTTSGSAPSRPHTNGASSPQEQALGCSLHLDNLVVRFDQSGQPVSVLNGLSFELHPGQIGCLLGPSGCGKTTAMRTVAGFIRPDAGTVRLDDQVLCGDGHWVEPEHRSVGIVFQDYALFPHLTTAQNIAFGLRKVNRKERAGRVSEMLALTGLQDEVDKYPHELSGGQQQRVALARALAPRPRLLLLDEPFSNLDPDLRERLAEEVRLVLKAAGTTALLVTHDQYEAFAMADHVGVVESGRIAQWDTPYNLYHLPGSRSVADFVGQGTFLRGEVTNRDGQSSVDIELGNLPIAARSEQALANAQADVKNQVDVLLRPDDVVHDDDSAVKAEVVRKAFRGASFMYTLRLPSGNTVMALVPSHHDHDIGEHIGIKFDADHVVTFERQSAD